MKKILFIVLITIISTLLVWLPFSIKNQMSLVFSNFDGPNYIAVAKCWYDKACLAKNFSLPLPLEYYPAHFPGYSLIVKAFSLFLAGWWAMLAANLLTTITMAIAFYQLLKQLKIKKPLWLTTILLFLPARILILRTVGAPETLFISATLISIIFFRKKEYFKSAIFLSIAQLTKSPAIILLAAYGLNIFLTDKFDFKKWLKKWPLILGPLTIIGVFYFYYLQTGDFWAYFNSGDNFHIFFPPFQAFIGSQSWLGGDFWLEDIIYIYLIGGVAILSLIKKYKNDIIALFPALFYLSTLFVAHRDISRYSAPIYAFWIIAFAPYLKKKEFKVMFFIILPAIFLYAINFITYNVAPVADWTPYL